MATTKSKMKKRRKKAAKTKYVNKMEEARIRILRREMLNAGYDPDAVTKGRLKSMANKMFKSTKGKELQAFGSRAVLKDNKIVWEKVTKGIKAFKLQQMESFRLAVGDEEPMTFGQQLHSNALKSLMGNLDVYAIAKLYGVKKLNTSAEWSYQDPLTGETRSLNELIDRYNNDMESGALGYEQYLV